MKVDLFDITGKKLSKKAELPANIFEAPISVSLMHQAFVRQMANARLGTHKTKTRHEVRGGGRKPWRQKGTGRARQGSIRSAQWVGGGKIHTPRPRNYDKKMPRKMRRAALRSALSAKAAESQIVVVQDLVIAEAKTKVVDSNLKALVGDAKTLILVPDTKAENVQNFMKSANNLKKTKTLSAKYLNVRDLLGYEKIVVPVEALDVIAGYLG